MRVVGTALLRRDRQGLALGECELADEANSFPNGSCMTAQSISGRAPSYACGSGYTVGGYFSRPPIDSIWAIAASTSSTLMSM